MKILFASLSAAILLSSTRAADAVDLTGIAYTVDSTFIQKTISVEDATFSCIDPEDGGHPDLRFFIDSLDEIYAFYMPVPNGSRAGNSGSPIFGKGSSGESVPVATLYGVNVDAVESFDQVKIEGMLPEVARAKRQSTVVYSRKRNRDKKEDEVLADPRNALAAKKGLRPMPLQTCARNRLCGLTRTHEFFSVNNCRSGKQPYVIGYTDLSETLHALETSIIAFDANRAESLGNTALLGLLINPELFTEALAKATTSSRLASLRKIAAAYGHLSGELKKGLQEKQKSYSFNENYNRMVTPTSSYKELKSFVDLYEDKKLNTSQRAKIRELADQAYLQQTRQAFESGDIRQIQALLDEHPEEADEIRSRFQHLYRKRGNERRNADYFALAYRMEPNAIDYESFLKHANDQVLLKEFKAKAFTRSEHFAMLVGAIESRKAEQQKREAAQRLREEAIRKAQEARQQALEIAEKTVVDDSYALMWQDVPKSAYVRLKWHRAVNYCKKSTLLGLTDWILPDVHDLMVLYRKRKQLQHLELTSYWTSEEKVTNKSMAFEVDFDSGIRDSADKEEKLHVRCVRRLPKKKGYFD